MGTSFDNEESFKEVVDFRFCNSESDVSEKFKKYFAEHLEYNRLIQMIELIENTTEAFT